MEHIQALFLNLVHTYGYAGLFVAMVLGNLAVPIGSEFVVLGAGAAAGAGHLSSWVVVGAVATLGEIVGGSILYAIGYFAGEPVVRRFGSRAEHELQRVHAFYDVYGKKTVFVCRFIPLVRGIASLPPGISRMQKRYFLTFHALGSAIFCFGLALLGDMFGIHIGELMPLVHRFSILVLVVAVIAGGTFWWFRAKAARQTAR